MCQAIGELRACRDSVVGAGPETDAGQLAASLDSLKDAIHVAAMAVAIGERAAHPYAPPLRPAYLRVVR
jgi:hypothetical protein